RPQKHRLIPRPQRGPRPGLSSLHKTFPTVLITKAEIATFTTARNATPHSLLGMHTARKGTSNGLVVRAFLRETEACEVVDLTKKTPAAFPMTRLDDAGSFEVFIPRRKTHFRNPLRATRADRNSVV